MKKLSAILLFTLLISGCSSEKIKFEKGSGSKNEIKAGTKFKINLPEDHTTGYLWILKYDFNPNTIHYINSVYHSTKGGNVDFNFKAHSAGETDISLFLLKHRDTLDKKTYTIKVLN